MFDPQAEPRVFAVPPGSDFCRALVDGLIARTTGADPMRMARIRLLVNTRRTGRRIAALFADGGARLLPRITPVTDLASALARADLTPPVPDLRRRLQLVQVVLRLLDLNPDLAPRAAAFDLADSLARLLDEMHEEGVGADALIGQDFGDLSHHWQRSVRVLSLLTPLFASDDDGITPAARLAALVRQVSLDWIASPPADPIIVAGSTGSRGTTFRLMQAVARLPQGALVLPGYDFGLPESVWQTLLHEQAEDHPQFRFARLRQALDLAEDAVRPWSGDPRGQRPRRGALISLSLRPAPVSDQWFVEGPALGDLTGATEDMDLIEAPTSRLEALAIATALRKAVAQRQTAAVVTPNRALTRQIAAELDRWDIVPDDSAGEPLGLTARGRLLRHAAEALVAAPRVETLLVILNHPLVHSAADRARHLCWTRELELRLRRDGRPWPRPEDLARLIPPERAAWAGWIADALLRIDRPDRQDLADHVRAHVALVELLAAGEDPAPDGPLWSGAEGREARRVLADLQREAEHAFPLTPAEYRDLVTAILDRGEVRQTGQVHPGVRFWGTIEARVQGADLVILAGLNDGLWPAHPAADPWMNRRMRRAVGLTLPERRIGLSAHDYQQAVMAPRVILTRATRDEQAETVPSRWLSRLTNLLDGLPTGAPALQAMRTRGNAWLNIAAQLDRPAQRLPAAPRPSPRPPLTSRPSRLRVTEIKTLVQDPYAIYAERILRLRPLDPVRPGPDTRLSGTLIHKVLERFVRATLHDPDLMRAEILMAMSDDALTEGAPWPGMRQVWRAAIQGFADRFVASEALRQTQGRPQAIEEQASLFLPAIGLTLIGKPDRIDLKTDGSVEIFDYKTGTVPTKDQIDQFDQQLMLLALMAEHGAFAAVAGRRVSRVAHLRLGRDSAEKAIALDEGASAVTLAGLTALIAAYGDPNKGYLALRANDNRRWEGAYDHLARFGEWSVSDAASAEDFG